MCHNNTHKSTLYTLLAWPVLVKLACGTGFYSVSVLPTWGGASQRELHTVENHVCVISLAEICMVQAIGVSVKNSALPCPVTTLATVSCIRCNLGDIILVNFRSLAILHPQIYQVHHTLLLSSRKGQHPEKQTIRVSTFSHLWDVWKFELSDTSIAWHIITL